MIDIDRMIIDIKDKRVGYELNSVEASDRGDFDLAYMLNAKAQAITDVLTIIYQYKRKDLENDLTNINTNTGK